MGGHICAEAIMAWLLEGATEIRNMFAQNPEGESSWILANINLDFTREIVWGKNVEVTTEVSTIGNSSLGLVQKVYQDASLCAKGMATFINYNYPAHKPEIIPQTIRIKLEEHLTTELD